MFGPQPTEEEWKVWCKQNKQLWDSEYWLKSNMLKTSERP